MHRDHKLGLALGVLVIGFAAALCFPRHPAGTTASLELTDAAQLDADIELLPVRAYTESDSKQAETAHVTPGGGESPGRQEAALPAFQSAGGGPELFAGAPEPIRAVAAPSGPPTPGSAVWSPVRAAANAPPSSSSAAALPEARPQAADAGHNGMRYTVRPGDTLSGLAGRYLGSTQRYLEIYEANRDVLTSPNAIRAGLVLTIPTPDRSATADFAREPEPPVRLAETIEGAEAMGAESTPRAGEASQGDARRRADDGEASRFRPAGRSPFLPGPARPKREPSQAGPRPATNGNGE